MIWRVLIEGLLGGVVLKKSYDCALHEKWINNMVSKVILPALAVCIICAYYLGYDPKETISGISENVSGSIKEHADEFRDNYRQ